MKRTILYDSVKIDTEKKKIFYKIKEENAIFNVKFEDLTHLQLPAKDHYIVFKELLHRNYPEEFL